MALEYKLDEEGFNGLGEELKTHYAKTEDGSYKLDLGGSDPDAAVRAKNREKEKSKELSARLAALEEEKAKQAEESLKKSGDIDALEKSYGQKLTDMEQSFAQQIESKNKFISSLMLDREADSLASSLSDSPVVMMPHIKSRLRMDFDGEEPKLRVLDAQGQISSLTIEDLKKEFTSNDQFKSIIKGSNAEGGRTPQNNNQNSYRKQASNDSSFEATLASAMSKLQKR